MRREPRLRSRGGTAYARLIGIGRQSQPDIVEKLLDRSDAPTLSFPAKLAHM